MGISNFPFPSFTLLLTSDRVVIPGRSYVFRLAPLEISHQHVLQDAASMSTIDNLDVDLVEDSFQLANLDLENDSTIDDALCHPDFEEFIYDITDTISMSTDETRSVQTTISGSGQAEEEVGVGVGIKFFFPFLKTRSIELKNIFKRLSPFKLNGHQ